MPAYLYVEVEVTDPEGYAEYRERAPATIAAHGGRYLVRGGASEVLEGEAAGKRRVILEFPDMARLKAWYGSAAYRPLIALRQRTTRSMLLAIEGVAPQ
jgi:uncharacterized protein (DUF1330 family)